MRRSLGSKGCQPEEACTHRRLCGSLSRGDGELHNAEGAAYVAPVERLGCVLWFSGFLSQPDELRRMLGIDGTRAAEHGLLLAHAYRRWGEHLHAHVLGEYVLCLYDHRSGRLILTQDALGLRGLFYSLGKHVVCFATHVEDLMDAAEVQDIDHGYVARYLAHGRQTDSGTPFAAIARLLPGRTLVISSEGCRDLRTWDATALPEVRCANDDEYEERFRFLLNEAVRATANRGAATWVALSGGLDSSSIASVAGCLGLEGLGSYSFVSPQAPQGDEQLWARAVIEQSPMPWHRIDVEDALPFAELPGADAFRGEPTSAVIQCKGNRVLQDLLREHKVGSILTGHGGDALLGSSPGQTPSHLADLLVGGRPYAAWKALKAWSRDHHQPRSTSFLIRHALFGPVVAHMRGRRFGAGDALPIPPWITPEYAGRWGLKAAGLRQVALPGDRYPGRQEILDSVWELALSAGSPPPGSGHDVRRPLLYRPFFEFMYAVPGTQRFHPRCDRWLQRRALRGVLPEVVRRRGTKLFGTWALVEGLARSRSWIDYLGDDPEMVGLGITTSDAWREALVQATVGNTMGDRFFITAVALEVWLKQMKARRSDRRPLTWTKLERAGSQKG